MKKKIISIVCISILIIIGFEILTEADSILQTVSMSLNIWANNIFPSLFPFFVLSEILINFGFIELVGELCKPLMHTLFKCKGEVAFVFIMSMLSGFPSNAKYVKELYSQGILNENEASKALMFTHFSNPLFILGTISLLFLQNKTAGLMVLIFHYLGNIIIGFIFRNYYPTNEKYTKVSLKTAINKMHHKRVNNKQKIGLVITNSLQKTINTLLLILGVVTMFLCLTTIINNNVHLNEFSRSLLNGFIEMTQGLKYVSVINIPLKIKTVISTLIISFGGFSVHMQLTGILSDTNIKYLPFLTARILHAFISSFLVYIFFDLLIYI